MSDRTPRVPSYRCKKVRGRKYACVSLPDGLGGRRDVLLGKFGTKKSRAEYARVIGEWEAAGRRVAAADPAADLTVNELILAYWRHAEQHYRRADGTPTNELNDLRLSFRPLKEMYGHTLAGRFGPRSLKAIRDKLVKQPIKTRIKVMDPTTGRRVWQEKVLRVGLARGVVNQRVNRIRRLFRWGVENELVSSSVLEGLRAVRGLQRGRSVARETPKVRPVSPALVEERSSIPRRPWATWSAWPCSPGRAWANSSSCAAATSTPPAPSGSTNRSTTRWSTPGLSASSRWDLGRKRS
jgi:hypothetical protein